MSDKGIFRPCLPRSFSRRAFTLIELLVVISIVALLMAVLLPTLGRVRKQARAVACQAHLRQWGVAFSMYLNEHPEQLVWDTWRGKGPSWSWSRWYYGDANDLLLCPAATRWEVNKNYPKWEGLAACGGGVGSKSTAWKVQDSVAGRTFNGSYGLNPVGYSVIRPNATVSLRGGTASSHLFRLGGSRTPILADSALWWAAGGASADPPAYDGDLSDLSGTQSVCIDRHDGTVNSLFLDWSVRRVGLKELWTLRWYLTCDIAGPWTKAGGVEAEDWPEWMRKFKDY